MFAGVLVGLPILAPIVIAVRARHAPVVVRGAVALAGLFTASYLLWAYEVLRQEGTPTGEGIPSPPELLVLGVLPSTYLLVVFLAIALGSFGRLLHYLWQRSLFSRDSLMPSIALAVCLVVASLFGHDLFHWAFSVVR
jgi:hypothetical protein